MEHHFSFSVCFVLRTLFQKKGNAIHVSSWYCARLALLKPESEIWLCAVVISKSWSSSQLVVFWLNSYLLLGSLSVGATACYFSESAHNFVHELASGICLRFGGQISIRDILQTWSPTRQLKFCSWWTNMNFRWDYHPGFTEAIYDPPYERNFMILKTNQIWCLDSIQTCDMK